MLISLNIANSASVSISTVRGTDQVAPEGIWFSATLSGLSLSNPVDSIIYEPLFHEPLYVWDFDETGTFTAPNKLLSAWDDIGVGYGPEVSHVFGSPGTYSVSVSVYHPTTRALIATDSISVTVKDPATEFSGTRTIVVANDSDFTGAPSGSDQYSTLSAALTAYQGLGQTGRLLLKRGETYDFLTSGNLNRADSNYDNFHLGAWGSGAKPICNLSATARGIDRTDMAAANDMTLWGLRFEGSYDPTTESGATNEAFEASSTSDGHNTFYDLEVSGASRCALNGSGVHIMQEVNIEDWQNYGCSFGPNNTRIGIKGVRTVQNPAARHGGDGNNTDGLGNDHGPWRFGTWGGTDRLYIGASEVFSNNGWSLSGGIPAHQPAIRISAFSNTGYINAERLYVEGGTTSVLSLYSSAGSALDVPGNILVDKSICVATHATTEVVQHSYGGATLRNIMFFAPNVKYSPGSNSWRGFIDYSDQGDDAQNLDEPIYHFNNTYVSLLDTTNSSESTPLLGSSGVFTYEERENIVEHWPDMTSPDTGDTPFDLVDSFITHSVSFQWSSSTTPDYSYGSPTHTLDFDAEVGAFTAGLVVTGGTSGATARIAAVRTGTLHLCDVSGTFQDNENITDTSTGDATADGAATQVAAIYRPQVGSAAYQDATSGRVAVDDILGTIRGGNPSRGCIEPA